MLRIHVLITAVLVCLVPTAVAQRQESAHEPWKIYVTNDNCPDYTWGFTEEQTRQAFADVVRGHLDEMKRTDGQSPETRDRYNMAVTQEALCFVEKYPDRKQELIDRIKEGRVYVSPYLCNSLWGMQSAEGVLRTFYPARRLEREWGISLTTAHHIELPSLPWGTATLLAGCGIRHLSNPYLDYDCTFKQLQCPPLFYLEGPDGSRIKVCLDRFASSKSNYTQGRAVFQKPDSVESDWVAHYAGLGAAYPLRSLLASGTHGDISPNSGNQAQGFADAMIRFNDRPGDHPRLVNATFPMFWQEVESAEARQSFLPTLRGCLGHSWDLWPVSLAKYVAAMRAGERRWTAAETLVSLAGQGEQSNHDTMRQQRERAEWCWAMLSDHAWNGTDERNKRHNAELRRRWGEDLNGLAAEIEQAAWKEAVDPADKRSVVLFNSLSGSRRGLVCVNTDDVAKIVAVRADGRLLPVQPATEDGGSSLCFVVPELPGFRFRQVELVDSGSLGEPGRKLMANSTLLESPFYRLVPDVKTGGISSLVHVASGKELITTNQHRTLCQTVYYDGREHLLENVRVEPLAAGPVFARIRISGEAAGVNVQSLVTVYAELDRVDFEVRVEKQPGSKEERLCQVFPLLDKQAVLRAAASGAVVRPRPQPAGDLLPGADPNRFAVQDFINAAHDDVSVTLVPHDAFVLRLDLDHITFEALGNDQNYREVLHDQDGQRQFQFRYSLKAEMNGYRGAEAVAFAQSAALPLSATIGRLITPSTPRPTVDIDAARAVATCLKPVDDPRVAGMILRLWETAGQDGPVRIGVTGFAQAVATDLLEREQDTLAIRDGAVEVNLKQHGYAALRLVPLR
jgi:hypothetical protein